jgi:hypothetical protein
MRIGFMAPTVAPAVPDREIRTLQTSNAALQPREGFPSVGCKRLLESICIGPISHPAPHGRTQRNKHQEVPQWSEEHGERCRRALR